MKILSKKKKNKIEKEGYGGWVKWDDFEEEDEERDEICVEKEKI